MKTKYAAMVLPLLVAGGLVMVSGCIVEGPPPPPVAVAPAPPDEVQVVPDDYVWDGTEYVGTVGDQYYYLGPGNVWIVCDPVRIDRFHAYINVHPDWRAHMTVNARFRNDAHGVYHAPRRAAPRRDDRDHH